MILIDTSVWISLLSLKPQHTLIEAPWKHVAICPPIVQEILQGVSQQKAYQHLSDSLFGLKCFDENISLERCLQATNIYREGRKKGKTIRSSIDCLIAAIAIEHDLFVWHHDRDFDSIATYTSLRVSRDKSFGRVLKLLEK